EFQVRRGVIDFDDEHGIEPRFDVLAETEIRRGGDLGDPSWRILLRAHGTDESVQIEPSSEPALSQEDIILLLTIGLTREEADRLQAGELGQTAAIEALATVTGVDREVQRALPVIDDFRITSAYSRRTGRTEPQVVIGRRISDRVRVSASTGFSEERDMRALVEWRLGEQTSVQGVIENGDDSERTPLGNMGLDLRWRLEFE
ncbi:MAG: translocation/assembly module TamB domain-containing protein, partial [Deltaproteobacteria bacterium]|nr:translocation/assembly module TamB domain-containing protein [Deltaproteobacteria bacterium]